MSTIDDFKGLYDLLQDTKRLDLWDKITGLREENLSLREELLATKGRLSELEDEQEIESQLVFENNCYMRRMKDGTAEGPFCCRCWDTEKVLARMQRLWPDKPENQSVRCPECKTCGSLGGVFST